MVKIGSLFTGYGGLDMAAVSLTGGSVAWVSEVAPFPARLLAHNLPGVPNIGDVKTVNWDDVPPVDVITAGYPCQPFSVNGLSRGVEDERHLWPYVSAAVRALRPRLLLLENVQGHRYLGFDTVLGDLAADGYDAAWHSLRASDVGAPHHRDRLFVVASPSDAPRLRLEAGAIGTGLNEEEKSLLDFGGVTLPDLRPGEPWEYGDYWPVIDRWRRVIGRPPPTPVLSTREGRVLNPRFGEWIMGLPEGWISDVPGVTRNRIYEMLGNGVVPQQAEAALRYSLSLL